MSTKKKEIINGEHPTPDSTTKEKSSFCVGDEVLMQRKDGNFYLGTVVKIDLSRDQCQVKFGDNTETWSSFAKLTKLSTGLEIMCVKCKISQTETENDIVICDKCSRGYHQKCHYPEICDDYLKEDAKWECVRCSDVPEKRTLPQRKSSTSAPVQTPTSFPPPSAQSTPKPLPNTPKNSPQTAKLSPPPSSKPSTLLTKSSLGATKPTPSAPKTVPLSAIKTTSAAAKPIPAGVKPSFQCSKPTQQTIKPSAPLKPKSPNSTPTVKSQPQTSKTTLPTKPSPPSPPPPPPTKASPPPPPTKPSPPPPSTKLSSPPPSTKLSSPPPSTKLSPPPPTILSPPPPPSTKATPLIPKASSPIKTTPPPKPAQTQPFLSEPQPKSTSTPPTPPSTPTESVCSVIPVATEAQKKKLPYNLNDLHWDLHHRSNTENKYCYCGGPGKWFLKMLQCTRCRQWFHGRCLSSLRYPLFYGDRFYVFLCTLCNSGKEFLRRLEVKWVDLVHLAIFNLTLKTAKKYVDVDEDILGFINKSWNELQLPPKILETTSDSEKREIVLSVLTSNRNRFKAAREVKSRKTKWGLRVRVPPPTPVFSLPPNKPLSDQVLSDAWNNSARLKFLPPPPRNSLPCKPEDDFDLSNLKDQLPGVDILHIETRMLVLPKGVPASGHNVCIKSSTPMYPESRAIKRRIKEQGMENDRLRRSRKARRLLRSSLSKEREKSQEKERQELPPTPPSSESNPEAAPSAQPESSGDETSSRGTLDSIIPPPVDFTGSNNPFLPLQPVLRPVKRKLSEKDIIVTSTGEVKRRKIRRSRLLTGRASTEGVGGGRGKVKRLKTANSTPTPTTSPVKNSPPLTLEELKSSVNQYFGAVNRINSGEDFVVMAKRIGLDGRTQYLINWGTPT